MKKGGSKKEGSNKNSSLNKKIEYIDSDEDDEAPKKIIEDELNDEEDASDYDNEEESSENSSQKKKKPTPLFCPKNVMEKLSKNAKILVRKADQNSDAQYRVGVNFYNGVGKYPKNKIIGSKYLQRAIKKGNEDAALFYGEKVIEGTKDFEMAESFIDDYDGNENSAFYILKGLICCKQNNYEDALEAFNSGYCKGSLKSAYQLGIMYRDGLGVKKDDVVAKSYFNKSGIDPKPQNETAKEQKTDKSEAKAKAKTTNNAGSNNKTKTKVKSTKDTDSKNETKTKTKATKDTDSKNETKTKTKATKDTDSKNETKTKTKATKDIDSKNETKTKTKATKDTDSKNETKTKVNTNASSNSETKTKGIKNTKDKNKRICPEDIYNQLSKNSKLLVQKADTDNDAQLKVAINFIDGVGKYPQDKVLGIKYLQKSIENGNEKAVIYYDENIIKTSEDIKKANKFVQSHSEDPNPTFDLLKGLLFMKKKDYQNAQKSFLEGLEKGNSQSAYQIGVLYQNGFGFPKDENKAKEYFEKSEVLKKSSKPIIPEPIISGPIIPAIKNTKNDSENENETDTEIERICPEEIYNQLSKKSQLLVQNADTDNDAQFKVAINFIDGVGKYPQDKVLGIKYLQKSIENGNEEAANYYYDKIIAISNKSVIKEADSFIKDHMNDDNPLINLLQGLLLVKKEKFDDAYKNIMKSYKKGSSRAAYQLGVFYRDGLGVQQDAKKSSDYFVKAKKLKNPTQPISDIISDDEENEEEEKEDNDDPRILYQKGIKCMNSKNVTNAIYFFKLAAQKEDVESMKELYNIYFNGIQPIEFSYKKALKYAKMAADKGDLESIINAAALYDDGCEEIGIKPNLTEAIKYYKIGADLGDVESMNKYALMLDNGEGTKANPKLACKYYQMAADKGNKFAMFNYAVMLIQGNGTKKDVDKATKYLEKSSALGYKNARDTLKKLKADKIKADADNGDVDAMLKYGKMLIYGKGIKKNEKEGLQYLNEAANQGNKNAKRELKIFEVEKLKNGIDNGDTESMIKLAQLLIEGKKVKRNLKSARSYLIRALKNGDEDAKIELKKLKEIQLIELNDPKKFFDYGQSFEFSKKNKDLEKAQFWYKKAADLDFILGILSYCRLLDNKLRDYRMAVKKKQKAPMTKDEFNEIEKEMMTNYKKAADKGNRTAQFHYGLCLEHGNGLKVDKKKAAEYYQRSSEKGLSIAMSNYARCLEHGSGVAKNEREALKWYKRAMNHGLERAKGEYNYLYNKLKKEEEMNEEEEDDDSIVDEEEEENHHNEEEEEDYNEQKGEEEDNADEENEEEEDNDFDENEEEEENDDDDLVDDDDDDDEDLDNNDDDDDDEY